MIVQHGCRKGLPKECIKKKFLLEQKRSTNGVIYAAFGKKIKNCLKNPKLEFRHYVKKKFHIII